QRNTSSTHTASTRLVAKPMPTARTIILPTIALPPWDSHWAFALETRRQPARRCPTIARGVCRPSYHALVTVAFDADRSARPAALFGARAQSILVRSIPGGLSQA